MRESPTLVENEGLHRADHKQKGHRGLVANSHTRKKNVKKIKHNIGKNTDNDVL